MADYSKPIGWCCRLKGQRGPGQWCTCAIPIFAVIPQGERPSTHPPRKDDVCTAAWPGHDDEGLCSLEMGRRWVLNNDDGTWGDGVDHDIGEIGDAVLRLVGDA